MRRAVVRIEVVEVKGQTYGWVSSQEGHDVQSVQLIQVSQQPWWQGSAQDIASGEKRGV